MRKLLNKIVAAAAAFMVSVSALILPSSAETPDFETAQQAVDKIAIGWNLGNTLDSSGDWIETYTDGSTSDYETAWGNPVTTKELITAVKDAGFNAVRVPVTWAQHIDAKGNIDSEWLDRVNEVVDYVISQNMYCILNTHHDGGGGGWLQASSASYSANSAKFAGLWKNIAERFRDYGEKLIFESYNEILDANTSWTNSNDSTAYTAANKFNQLFVDTVRATGGNNAVRNLMVQTYSGASSTMTLNSFVLPTDSVDDHLIIQVHNYDPQSFTSTKATWTTMTDTWGTQTEKDDIESLMAGLEAFAKKMGAPLVIGEFGAEYKNNNSSRAKYAEYFVESAYNHGIKCFWWDDGSAFELFDRTKNVCSHTTVLNAMMSAVPAPVIDADDIPQSVIAAIGGTVKSKFTLDAAGSASPLTFNTESGESGLFASLMKYDFLTGKAEYVSGTKIEGSTITLNADGAGAYFLLIDTENKKPGDMNNDGKVNAFDALQILKNIADAVPGSFKSDFNQDQKTNAFDALEILKSVTMA